jgi:LacI family transcriptional regulator
MAEKVSMEVIAKKLGISKNTVSLALRGIPGISERTRSLVTDMANKLGYHYKSSDRKKELSRNLCIVIPRSARDSIGFFSFIQLGIEDEARRNNINTILHYYDESDAEFVTPLCIREGMISGIITLGRISERTVRAIRAFRLPVVMVDHYFDDIELDCVLTDNQCGCYIATEYLINKGHRDIGFFGDIKASISFYDRFSGYLKALDNHGIPYVPSFSVVDKNLEELAKTDIYEAANVLKALGRLPTAFVCCNDAEAITLCKALKTMDVPIPERVSVVGFDDIEASRNVTPELTTMRVRKELMGRKAVSKLLSLFHEKDGIPEKLLLSADLIERSSVTEPWR